MEEIEKEASTVSSMSIQELPTELSFIYSKHFTWQLKKNK